MDVRTILYINVFLLAGCTAGLAVIAFHHRRFRQFFLLAIAYAIGCLSTILRMQQGHLPDFFVLVLSNFFLVATLLLIRYADAAVRIPCRATAALYILFSLMTAIRCVGILFWGVPHNFFIASISQLFGFLGFYILIVGIPIGYFWMTSTRLYANQELLARTDSLTGLLNRRGLEEQAIREIKRSRRHGTPLTVLAMDLDHFKNINDRYGHETGDAVLCSVATALAVAMRSYDIAARLGGEEFIGLLVDTNAPNATSTAERIRSTIEALDVYANGHRLRFTASFGIAAFQPDDTLESVLRRADQALYAAKLAGRNCVMQEPVAASRNIEA